ncbi:MAG TPA: pitrilysin family protein [Acidiferrobacterales bacterium]
MRFSRVAVVALVVALAACSKVHETTLDNGLKVVVKQDHRSPVVVSQIWYRVGSVDEPAGLTGISHVLEHLMFKGTANHKAGEFSRIVAENGGRENAFTSRDYTAYFQQLEKSRLKVSFELEADRMQNLLLDPGEVRKEIQVVMEERRLRTDDQPEGLLYERFMETAYTTHSYRHPVIGWMRDLERITLDDLRDWYRRFYAPNNATLVVVGDVRPREVFALARQYFGPVPRRDLDATQPEPEPPQREERRVRVGAPAEVPSLLMGFHATRIRGDGPDWEPYALQVLTGVLDGGNSARFARELVRGQAIAAGADAEYRPYARDPVQVLFSGTPARGRSIADLEAAILAQIERLQAEPVTGEELDRVKAQVVASEVYGRDSVFYQAMQIGTLETVGLDWHLMDEYVKRIRAVTAKQVQAVAKKYLVAGNRTVAVLDPQPLSGKKRPAPAPMGGHGVR